MICVPESAAQMCGTRKKAMLAGEMFFNYAAPAFGWVFPGVRAQGATQPFIWTHCPFCDGRLPASNAELLIESLKRALENGEGEE